MNALESLAGESPLSATTLAMRTVANDLENKEESYAFIGISVPIPTEDS
jgi:hypothetical protein